MKTLAEKIAVMQAALDGKAIEYTSDWDTWYSVGVPSACTWNWTHYDFRVAQDMDEKAAEIYGRAAYPYVARNNDELPFNGPVLASVKLGVRAVIEAVKRGELQ